MSWHIIKRRRFLGKAYFWISLGIVRSFLQLFIDTLAKNLYMLWGDRIHDLELELFSVDN
jgi:hypothetical protein